jgi:hypothetical protein
MGIIDRTGQGVIEEAGDRVDDHGHFFPAPGRLSEEEILVNEGHGPEGLGSADGGIGVVVGKHVRGVFPRVDRPAAGGDRSGFVRGRRTDADRDFSQFFENRGHDEALFFSEGVAAVEEAVEKRGHQNPGREGTNPGQGEAADLDQAGPFSPGGPRAEDLHRTHFFRDPHGHEQPSS